MAFSNGADEAALERSYTDSPPIDVAVAERILREAKEILDQLGVVFFLRQGTCLGAIRDGTLIPWDDDVDLGSVIGLNALNERSIDRVVAAFRSKGYFAKVESNDHYVSVALMKWSTRLDWACYRTIKGNIIHYPGVRIPIRLFTELKEIDFIDSKFLVPNPPEEYLNYKYGPSWMVQKKREWVKDVVAMIPEASVPGHTGKLRQLLSSHVLRRHSGRLRVLDDADNPVAGAEVVVAGLGRSRTNKQGYARFYLPRDDFYAVVIKFGNREEVLYEERMNLGSTYIYRPDPLSASGRINVLSRE